MAIQLPNPGLGDGQTGDNEFVMWNKVKDNFSDQTNAASKLLGKTAGTVPLVDNVNNIAFGTPPISSTVTGNSSITALSMIPAGGAYYVGGSSKFSDTPVAFSHANYTKISGPAGTALEILHGYGTLSPYILYMRNNPVAEGWMKIYHDKNTTKDANGFLKAASPIVKVFADKVELNGEAEDQDVNYKKNGIGDYTITTVSGLSTDGWYIELPKDMNGNPKVAVTLSEVDGVISLKTYKRVFSMETFTFEPDLNEPLDIPDTRWIDLRLNEIPVEIEDGIQTEV